MSNRQYELKNEYANTISMSNFTPTISLSSNKEALIEGSKGIVKYSDTEIDINCKKFILRFIGFDLSIKALNAESISVNGKITQINFLTV